MTVAEYEFTTVAVSSVPGNTGFKPSNAVPKNRIVFVDALAPIKRFELYLPHYLIKTNKRNGKRIFGIVKEFYTWY